MNECERFDVWQYLPDCSRERVGRDLDASAAVAVAHSYTTRPAAQIGVIRQVQIVSRDDDATVFLWRFKEGVVFPTKVPKNRKLSGDVPADHPSTR